MRTPTPENLLTKIWTLFERKEKTQSSVGRNGKRRGEHNKRVVGYIGLVITPPNNMRLRCWYRSLFLFRLSNEQPKLKYQDLKLKNSPGW